MEIVEKSDKVKTCHCIALMKIQKFEKAIEVCKDVTFLVYEHAYCYYRLKKVFDIFSIFFQNGNGHFVVSTSIGRVEYGRWRDRTQLSLNGTDMLSIGKLF